MTARYADINVDRARWRINYAWRVTPRFQLGIEQNPSVSEFVPNFNWLLQTESERQPLISLGTSSDRIGTPEGNQAYYLTVAKGLPGGKVAPYVSFNYSEFDKRMNLPFGVNWSLSRNWEVLAMNDGRRSHALLTYRQKEWSASLISIWMERVGVSVSVGF